jgi:hypothetical protein
MVAITFNDQAESIASIEEFGIALDRFNCSPKFELWLSVEGGPSICMLRNGEHAWLMYLRFEGDSGFVSQGELSTQGGASYELANGQVDEYPLAWCIDVKQCYKALAYFFANGGAQTDWVSWHAS